MITGTLDILHQHGYDLDPVIIGRTLAEDYGWGPVSAKLVDELAEDLKSGNREFFGSSPIGYGKDDENTVKKWKAKARV